MIYTNLDYDYNMGGFKSVYVILISKFYVYSKSINLISITNFTIFKPHPFLVGHVNDYERES